MKYKLLVIPGGGIFGCIPAYFLHDKDINNIDIFAGTSVGSHLSLMYALGYTPDQTYSRLLHSVRYIFKRSVFQKLKFTGPKYSDKKLNEILKFYLDAPFGDLKPCLIPSYHYPQRQPKIFDNITDTGDSNIPAWEIARCSSSAPYYFPPYKGYIDGGWWANDPSLIASLGIEHKMGIPLEDLDVLTVGTGKKKFTSVSASDMRDWSVWRWLKPVLESITLSNEQGTSWCCERLPFNSFTIFDPYTIPDNFNMDEPEHIPDILQKMQSCKNSFNKIWDKFII